MKKITLILLILLIASSAEALELRPNTVKSMDVTITTEAKITFSGTIARNDEMKILFLSGQDYENQQILSIEEYMMTTDKKINPSHITRNNLKYAQYTIPDLSEYANTNEFTLVRKIRIKSRARTGMGNDYNLNFPIEEFGEYLKPTSYIESDDTELVSKALLEFTKESEIETVREITEWVNSNITYDFENYYSGIYSAKNTYNTRAGVCDEFANLSAAFTRIKKIPTRYVSGVSFDGERFGAHGWIEAYLPGTGWIGIDSTYAEAGYVDGAHFAMAKTADANSAIDFIINTTSRHPIRVESGLALPVVEINSAEFFDNLLDAKIKKPQEIGPNETFEISAEIKNISNETIMLPVELVLHQDFHMISKNQSIVLFRKGETKTLTWQAIAPQKDLENSYYTYGVLLLLADGNIADTIKLANKKVENSWQAGIVVEDVSPFINENNLEIKIIMKNNSSEEKNAQIEILIEGKIVAEQNVTLRAFEQKTIIQQIQNLSHQSAIVKIKNGQEQIYEIKIPQKNDKSRKMENGQISQPSKNDLQTNPLKIVSLEIAGIALIALLMAGITAYVLFAKKT